LKRITRRSLEPSPRRASRYAFGTHDGYNLWEAPEKVSTAAVALAITGGGR
jgi:hypothetical protein